MSLRIPIVFVLVTLAGLWAVTVMAGENQADVDAVLHRLDAIEDSFADRFDDLEREIGGLRRLPSIHTASMTQEGDSLADSAPPEDCQCQQCSRCPCCCCPTGLEAGVEATFLKLFPGSGGPFGSPNFDTRAAPRIWLGYRYDDAWGIRARYWDYFTQANAQYIQRSSGYSSSLLYDFSADVYSVDVELTRRAYIGNWSLLGSTGARYGSISTNLDGSIQTIDLVANEVTVGNGGEGEIFDGVGLTFALDGKRPIGFWDLSLVFNLRGSVLWGTDSGYLWGNSTTLGPDGAGNLIIIDTTSVDLSGSNPETMWIGEAQLGLEWSQPFEFYGGGDIFARGVLEVQSWSRGNPGSEDVFFGSAFAAGFTR